MKNTNINKFDTLLKLIKSAKKTSKLSHAFLLNSDNTIIREELAYYVAKMILCQTPLEDASPCDSCIACSQVNNKSYAELFELTPVSKSRQITIGKDERELDTLRWFEHQFYLSSSIKNGQKIGIIFDAECMNQEAQNAFLKTLEEPPRRTTFILATSNPSLLLPTIISRCQQLSALTNEYEYNFTRSNELFDALAKLVLTKDFISINSSSITIIDIINSLKTEAESVVRGRLQKEIDHYDQAKEEKSLVLSVQKRFDLKLEAAIRAEYLKLRSVFISGIHTWFSLAVQVKEDIDPKYVSNYEIIEKYVNDLQKIDIKITLKALSKVEDLLQSLKTNVNENLVFREFCLSFIEI